MLRLIFMLFLAYAVYACESEDPTDDSIGNGIWMKSTTFPGESRVLAVSFQNRDNVYVGMGLNYGLDSTYEGKYLNDFYKFNGTTWTSVGENFPDKGREGCVAFVIGDTAYVGAGRRARGSGEEVTIYYSDFYKFDLANEIWARDRVTNEPLKTDIADYVVGSDLVSCKFWGGIGFELNAKGYVGTGSEADGLSPHIFCYDPQIGNWTSSRILGDPRMGAVVFKLGEKAVVCLGTDGGNNNRAVVTFDGTTWEEKSPLVDRDRGWDDDYDEIPRSYAVAFTSDLDDGLCGYIAGGNSNTVWRYDLKEDRWCEVEEFLNAMDPRVGGIGFSINGIGYITTGGSSISAANNNSTWKFTPGVDEDDY